MPQVAVVTDSTANLPPEMAAARDVTVVPLYVVFGPDRTERESDITDYPAFFEELRGSESLPSTSQPSVGDFMAAYQPLLADGLDIVSIHISSGLLGTYDSELRAGLHRAADDLGTPLHDGVYLAVSGPTFETPAEIRAFGLLGADLVGMSTVPEAIVARHCGLRVAAVSVVTNLAEGMGEVALSHEQTLAEGERGAASLAPLLRRWVASHA